MTRLLIIVTLLLAGCNTHVAGLGGYLAIELAKPVARALVDQAMPPKKADALKHGEKPNL